MKFIQHYADAALRCGDQADLIDPRHIERRRCHQQRMKTAVDHGTWAESGWCEPFTQKFVETIQGSSVFVDVGAELGFYSYLASKLMPPGGKIIAIEPDPLHCDLLRSLFEEARNVEIVPAAASDEPATIMLVKPPGCSATAAEVEGRRFETRTVVLDELLSDVGADVMKIDVEGAEAAVFNGMRRLLSGGCLRIFWEFHPWIDDVRPGGVQLIDRLLAGAAYRIYRVDRNQYVPPARLGGQMYLEPASRGCEP